MDGGELCEERAAKEVVLGVEEELRAGDHEAPRVELGALDALAEDPHNELPRDLRRVRVEQRHERLAHVHRDVVRVPQLVGDGVEQERPPVHREHREDLPDHAVDLVLHLPFRGRGGRLPL